MQKIKPVSNKAKHIFENLKGEWTFERNISDNRLKISNQASGKATFTLIDKNDKNVLLYEEKGILWILKNSKKTKFNRQYIYKLKNDEIHIIFNDGLTKGNLFQKLIPSENNFIGTEHICQLDKYNGIYQFKNAIEFNTEFTAIGPSKDLKIKSFFTKTLSKDKIKF